MPRFLMVPIRLDALHLDHPLSTVEAMADFTRLPHVYQGRDHNPDTAYISEDLVARPFENQNLLLAPGIHLHWTLPDVLTRGLHGAERISFARVPNRWLVRRSIEPEDDDTSTQMWVVESDYLYPPDATVPGNAIPYPVQTEDGRPFRYMGRYVPFESWSENSTSQTHLQHLTAVGYGDPAFAAFYPNCSSVFGFYDPDTTAAPPARVNYDVLGWYAKPADDFLNRTIMNASAAYEREYGTAPANEYLQQVLNDTCGWTFNLAPDDPEFPHLMLCYARFTFTPPEDTNAGSSSRTTANVALAVGNSPTEALAAHLGAMLAPDTKHLLEDQLEAMTLAPHIEHRAIDLGAAFQEARHNAGFTARNAGVWWTIRERTGTSTNKQTLEQAITLPDALAHALDALNALQAQHDQTVATIEQAREQLFFDWYKYMLCAYPPLDTHDDYPSADEVRYFIEQAGFPALDGPTAERDDLRARRDAAERQLRDRLADSYPTYTLQQVPAPHFWQPNEPVLLLAGKDAEPTWHHQRDGDGYSNGLLVCVTPDDFGTPVKHDSITDLLHSGDLQNVFDVIRMQSVHTDAKTPGHNAGPGKPWNPLFLEWEVEVFPAEPGSNLTSTDGRYDAAFITRNYQLDQNAIDLSLPETLIRGANIYAGRSILTPHADRRLSVAIETYLYKRFAEDYFSVRQMSASQRSADTFRANAGDVLAWLENEWDDLDHQPDRGTLITLTEVYRTISAPDFHSLSQALSGFNDALLMRKQSMQLPVADPLGFTDYQSFSEDVRDRVQGHNRTAPQPFNDFNPIRTGQLVIHQLRLVDSFGQMRWVSPDAVTSAEALLGADGETINLPPRIVQPARLNTYWLAAWDGEIEMNAHPATSPICGWLVPNNLNGAIEVYDGGGRALGIITESTEWQSVPGDGDLRASNSLPPGAIQNPYLARLVMYVLGNGPDFLDAWLMALDSALENIDPASFAQHEGLALLMGRPIAVTRLALNLELLGAPANHQGWHPFRLDMQRPDRETSAFEQVGFPVRLGEHKQLDDGVVGYLIEDSTGTAYRDNVFYMPQNDVMDHPLIQTHDDNAHLTASAADDPVTLTLLLDPRAAVHVTTGILPTGVARIPPDQYAEALRTIQIHFLTAPILTGQRTLQLPLPNEPGYAWSWLARESGAWTEIATVGIIRRTTVIARFGDDGAAIWDQLVAQGWITPLDDILNADRARVVPRDQRASTDLGNDWTAQQQTIEALLDASRINPVQTAAIFNDRNVIREGWLKLHQIPSEQKQRGTE